MVTVSLDYRHSVICIGYLEVRLLCLRRDAFVCEARRIRSLLICLGLPAFDMGV